MTKHPSDSLWITIPNWESFQHYKYRNPTLIKVYTKLLHNPAWVNLNFHQRGVLLTIWLEYAASNGEVSVEMLRRYSGVAFRMHTLKSLSDAGFIELSASKPLAQRQRQSKNKNQGLTVASYEGNGPGDERINRQALESLWHVELEPDDNPDMEGT